jgi:hypothetical protein
VRDKIGENEELWRIETLRLAIILVTVHTAALLVLTPVMLATVNSEAPPVGALLVCLFDFPVYYLAFTWFQTDSALVAFILFPLIAGTLQWFLIGLVVSFVRRKLGSSD